MPRVKFITTGHSHLVGNFSAGDTYTGGEAECRHFVDDAHCAVWDEVAANGQAVQTPGPAAAAAKAPGKSGGARAPAARGASRAAQPAATPSPAASAPAATPEASADAQAGGAPDAGAPQAETQIGN